MLMQGDLDMNLVQRHQDSLKEFLRHTIMNQELIFRNQILELHRLYKIQKMLMRELSGKELGKYSVQEASTQSNLTQLASIARNAVPKEVFVPATQKAKEERTSSCHWLWSKHLDLEERTMKGQFPAVRFCNHTDMHHTEKQVLLNSFKEPRNVTPSIGNDFAEPDELKLSLGNQALSRENRGVLIEWDAMKGTMSDDNSLISFPAPVEPSFKQSLPSGPKISERANCDPSVESMDSESKSMFNSLDAGRKYCSRSLCDNGCSRQHQVSSFRSRNIDLNTIVVDSSPSCSDDDESSNHLKSSAVVSDGLPGEYCQDLSSTCGFQGKAKDYNSSSLNKRCNELFLHGGKEPSDALLDSDGGNNIRGIPEVGSMNLETLSQLPLGYLGAKSNDMENEHVELTSESSNSLVLEQRNDGAHANNSNDEGCRDKDAVLLVSDKSYRVLHDGESRIGMANSSSSSVKTSQSEGKIGKSNSSISDDNSRTSEIKEALSIKQGHAQPLTIEPKHDCSAKKSSAEGDDLIQKAAESLLQISSMRPVCSEDRSAALNELENAGNGLSPLSPSDSYELNVLMLEESNSEDYSVSSKAYEVTDNLDRDSSIRLRRGRRLKDFQKEILPGLASLSRQEILEDVNILQGVIRSREYRKLRAKMADGMVLHTPLRGRRSRPSHAGRRRYG